MEVKEIKPPVKTKKILTKWFQKNIIDMAYNNYYGGRSDNKK